MRRRTKPADGPFDELAEYNIRRAKGIVHTAEYEARMQAIQAAFDAIHGPPLAPVPPMPKRPDPGMAEKKDADPPPPRR